VTPPGKACCTAGAAAGYAVAGPARDTGNADAARPAAVHLVWPRLDLPHQAIAVLYGVERSTVPGGPTDTNVRYAHQILIGSVSA
jgi:hypothetical protein